MHIMLCYLVKTCQTKQYYWQQTDFYSTRCHLPYVRLRQRLVRQSRHLLVTALTSYVKFGSDGNPVHKPAIQRSICIVNFAYDVTLHMARQKARQSLTQWYVSRWRSSAWAHCASCARGTQVLLWTVTLYTLKRTERALDSVVALALFAGKYFPLGERK